MKIGLALGGGVAYGFAHIGVLKALEKYEIKPNIITGTSVGALIGGIYASGVPVDKVESIALNFKWLGIIRPTLPKDGLISLDGIEDFVKQHALVNNIEDTGIKFAAIATNLSTGEVKVFDKGPLSKAIRASCSLPGIFTPMKINNNIFVDGGILDNVPARAAKEMGADFVIGVDITAKAIIADQGKDDIFDILWKSLQLLIQGNTALKGNENKALDIMLMPDIKNYNPFDLSKKEEIIAKGFEIVEAEKDNIERAMNEKKSVSAKIKNFLQKNIGKD